MKSKKIFGETQNRGLRMDDIYNLLHNPEKFELTEGNQNQFFALAYNIKDIIKPFEEY